MKWNLTHYFAMSRSKLNRVSLNHTRKQLVLPAHMQNNRSLPFTFVFDKKVHSFFFTKKYSYLLSFQYILNIYQYRSCLNSLDPTVGGQLLYQLDQVFF